MPNDTAFIPQNGENVHPAAPVVPYSTNGRWESVDANSIGFPISGPSNTPIMGPDGSIYCIGNSAPAYGSIYANQNTAIPQPASIVQLPPIVQPIALVPFASQNQPMLQYDPNQRPPEPVSPMTPKYRKKPYRGISFVQIMCSLVIVALMCVLYLVAAGGKGLSTGLDGIFGLLKAFGMNVTDSAYYDEVLSLNFAGGLSAGFSADFATSLFMILVPIFSAVVIILSVVLAIYYLVKLAQLKSPRHFSVCALINLILCVGIFVCIILINNKYDALDLKADVVVYAAAGISLFSLILNFFARKNAYVLDEASLKKVYIINDAQ